MSTKTAIGNEKPSGLDGIPIAAVAPNLTSEADLPPSENLQQPSRDTAEDGHGSWESPDDPDNPYNWSALRKISISVIVSFGQLVTLMSTSMMASALGQIGHDLGIGESTTQVTFSIFVLGLAFAPFPIASFSEMYGRKPVWLFCNAFYILWNAVCPIGRSAALMVIARFLAGSGASVGITLTGPIMADMYRKEERGKSLAIATFVPYLGPALGPIVGGAISQMLEWPWLFYVLSMFNTLIWVIGLVFVRESYTPVLLARKHRAAAATSTPRSFGATLSEMAANLRRPLQLLWQRPIIQVLALIIALNFGVYCLLLSTFATLWIQRYGESTFVSTLHYIAISVGITLATQGGGRFMDWVFAKQKARSPGGIVT